MQNTCKELYCINQKDRNGNGYCAEHQRERAEEAEAERDALREQLATVTAERDDLKSQLDRAGIVRARFIGGRPEDASEYAATFRMIEDETPLGQALDGLGDEVEP